MLFHGLPRYFMFHNLNTSIMNSVKLTVILLPWLPTMIDLVSFQSQFDHGRPWSALCHLTFMVNHGQTMDEPWFTMVAVHEQPCSKHG